MYSALHDSQVRQRFVLLEGRRESSVVVEFRPVEGCSQESRAVYNLSLIAEQLLFDELPRHFQLVVLEYDRASLLKSKSFVDLTDEACCHEFGGFAAGHHGDCTTLTAMMRRLSGTSWKAKSAKSWTSLASANSLAVFVSTMCTNFKS